MEALATWWCYTAGVKPVGSETCTEEGMALFCISVDPRVGEAKFFLNPVIFGQCTEPKHGADSRIWDLPSCQMAIPQAKALLPTD